MKELARKKKHPTAAFKLGWGSGERSGNVLLYWGI